MNKNDNEIKKDNACPMKELGFRFRLFRKAIRKTAGELASELGATLFVIKSIETGTIYPKITYLHYLYKEYGLNINWLLSQTGRMFVEKTGETANPIHGKYAELLELMQVPAVEQAISAALTHIRSLLELERDDFPDTG